MGVVRKTKHLQKVLTEFSKSNSAVSAKYLVSHFASSMNKSTIYRILIKLENDSFIHSFIGLDGLKWYAKCSNCKVKKHFDHHPHFHCEECNEVKCIESSLVQSKLIGSDFQVKSVLLTGLCPKCFSPC